MLKVQAAKTWSNFELDLDLEIRPAFTALFGPSGSGKTTTLNLIAGLTKPTHGEIVLNDTALFSEKSGINIVPQQRGIGYIFQESRLFPHYSVKENLEFGFNNTPTQKRRFSIDEIVEATSIGHLLRRSPIDLSGGEKQRVALARAILASPDYLLLDEPLGSLDLPARLSFLNFLKAIHRRLTLPILYVSHDLANVLNFAEHVVILENGKNIADGQPYSLLDKMTAAPLVSHADITNIMEMVVTSGRNSKGLTTATSGDLTFVLPHLDCVAGEKLTLNIPASEIILGIEKPTGLSATNILQGRITEIHHIGERILVELHAGQKFIVEVVPATLERLGLTQGKDVFLIFKASSFRKLS
ncbi:MAG: molybdenum ABC transporter ATP-binding protein [bacterium]